MKIRMGEEVDIRITRPSDEINYIIECAESVGITIDENTPIDFALIAEIMRRLRENDERH